VGGSPLLNALRTELDEALVSLQTARRMLSELQRSGDAGGVDEAAPAARSGDDAAPPSSLRFSGMTVAQAAVVLGIGEEQVRRLLRRRALEGVSLGGKAGWRLEPDYVRRTAAQWSALRAAQEAVRAPQRAARRRPPAAPRRPPGG
jgi:excisionase family DNA binding protein